MRKRIGTRLLSVLVALTMVVGLMPGMGLTAYASSTVSYMEWDANTKTLVEKSNEDYTVVTNNTTSFNNNTWYVVNSNVTIASRITVGDNATVHLILCDGCKLTASMGINVSSGATLNIYAQSEGTGELEATGTNDRNSGIGNSGDGYGQSGGTVTINGGIITATGGKWAAGIGCGGFNKSINGGTVTINGGTVNATGGDNSAGIGGGSGATGATVTINGGTVNATGYGGAAGIGGGRSGDGNTVKINGGTVTAISNPDSTGNSGCGIGRGYPANYSNVSYGKLTIAAGLAIKAGDNAEHAEDMDAVHYIDWYDHKHHYAYIYTPPHTHNFTYEATDATITASCSANNCPLTSNPTLALVKPTLTTYGQTGDGISAAATLTGLNDFKTATSQNVAETDIRYVGRDNTTYEESATAPTGAGKYTAKITVEGKTASVDYEIAKAAGSISYATANVSKTYGDAAFTNELTRSGDGTVSYACDKTDVATVNSETGEVNIVGIGEANITATVVDSDNSTYTTKTASYTLTVSAKPMTVSAEGYTGAYDSNPHSITVTVTKPTSGYTIAYGTTEGTYNLTASPEITNVSDSKTIYFKVTAPNYADYTGSAAVTISKADQTAPAPPTEASKSANSITLKTITNGEYKMGDGDTWQESPTFTGLTKNAEYSFYQRLKEDANHNASPASTPVAINTADHTHQWTYQAQGPAITATCGNTDGGHGEPLTATLTIVAPEHATYADGKSAEATITGSIEDVENPTVVYKKGDEALASAPTGAGTYTASITLGEADKAATASVEYTIAKADPTAAAPTGLTATYGDTLSKVALENPAGNTPGTWTFADAGTTSVGNVGSSTFKANFTPDDTANYKTVENVDVAVTVNKAANPATVAPSATVRSGGDEVDLADYVEMNGAAGDVSYQITGDAHGCVLEGSVFTPGSPKRTVHVSVEVTVAQDANHDALEKKTIDVEVVSIPVTGLVVEPARDSMLVGDELVLRFIFTPADATDTSIDIDSSDLSVATVDGSGNVHAVAEGEATITVTATNGTEETSDDVKATCAVRVSRPAPAKASIARAEVTAEPASFAYDGTAKEPALKVVLGGRELAEGTDYVVSFSGNVDAGTATATVTGKGRYTGAARATFAIEPADVSKAQVELSQTSFAYDGEAKEPAVASVTLGGRTLEAGTDYTVSYRDNVKAGTAAAVVTGKGNYEGAAEAAFSIEQPKPPAPVRADISKAKVTLAKKKCIYDGKAQEPAVVSVVLNGKTLAAGTDYAVSYENNTEPGAARAIVTGKGAYEGTAKASFKVALKRAKLSATAKPAEGSLAASWAEVPGAEGYELQWREPGGQWQTKAVSATSATVKGLKPGSLCDVRVRAVAGKAKGAWSPVRHRWLARTLGVTAKAGKSGAVDVTWKANAEASAGYLVVARYAKAGKNAAKLKVAAGETSATLSGLKSGKKVWVLVAPLRTDSGKTFRGVLSHTTRSTATVR